MKIEKINRGGSGQGGSVQKIEVFVEIQIKTNWGRVMGGWGRVGAVRVDVNE